MGARANESYSQKKYDRRCCRSCLLPTFIAGVYLLCLHWTSALNYVYGLCTILRPLHIYRHTLYMFFASTDRDQAHWAAQFHNINHRRRRRGCVPTVPIESYVRSFLCLLLHLLAHCKGHRRHSIPTTTTPAHSTHCRHWEFVWALCLYIRTVCEYERGSPDSSDQTRRARCRSEL